MRSSQVCFDRQCWFAWGRPDRTCFERVRLQPHCWVSCFERARLQARRKASQGLGALAPEGLHPPRSPDAPTNTETHPLVRKDAFEPDSGECMQDGGGNLRRHECDDPKIPSARSPYLNQALFWLYRKTHP